MSDTTKSRLVKLGADTLAGALVELIQMSPETQDMVERLLASPEERVQRVREALLEIKAMEGQCEGDDVEELADELGFVLDDIETSVDDPEIGVTLMAEFFETDETIFEVCDDASGDLSDIFTEDARDLFTSFACRCSNRKHLADTLFDLTRQDPYGVRGALIDNAWEFLDHQGLESLSQRFEALRQKEKGDNEAWHLERCAYSLADQL